MPVVTVLLPTYNSKPAHLRAAIECVKKQTLTDWELVIHDDPSATDVRDMIKDYLDDPRITFRRSEKRLGIGGNWNACSAFGTAPYVQLLFQDDLWYPEYLQRSMEALKRYPGIGFTVAHHTYRFEGEIDAERRKFYRGVEALQLAELKPGQNDAMAFLERWVKRGLRPNLIGEPSFVMLRRSMMKKAGPFRADMPQGLDVEYWLRCLVRSDFFFFQESLGEFRVHPAGATARNEAGGHGLFDRVGFYDTLLKEIPRGTIRSLVKTSLMEQFALMTRKFRERAKKGGKVGAGGSKSLIRIAVKHPVLVLRGMIKSI